MSKPDVGIIHDSKDVHTAQIGLHVGRAGICLYTREYWKYRSFQFGVSIEAVNGHDRYLDIELKLFCFGVGIRFIWIKKKKIKRENCIFVDLYESEMEIKN